MLFIRAAIYLLLAGSFTGCASHRVDARLDTLEARVDGQQVFDLRINTLENRVTSLEKNTGVAQIPTTTSEKKSLRQPRAVKNPSEPTVDGAYKKDAETPSMIPLSAHSLITGRRVDKSSSTLAVDSLAVSPIDETLARIDKEGNARSLSSGAKAPAKRPFSSAHADKAAYDIALKQYEAKNFKEAKESFLAFIQKYPSSTLVPNALYWYGECFYSRKDYASAVFAFKDVTAKYPKHPKSAAALLKIGMSYSKLKDTENAHFYWQILQDDFPGSAPAIMAEKQLRKK